MVRPAEELFSQYPSALSEASTEHHLQNADQQWQGLATGLQGTLCEHSPGSPGSPMASVPNPLAVPGWGHSPGLQEEARKALQWVATRTQGFHSGRPVILRGHHRLERVLGLGPKDWLEKPEGAGP